MNYPAIIKKAWAHTETFPYLKKIALIGAIVDLFFGILYYLYQGTYTWVELTERIANKSVSLDFFWDIWDYVRSDAGLLQMVIIIGIITVVFHVFLPSFIQGALIGSYNRIYHEKENGTSTAVTIGLHNYLKIFKLHITTDWLRSGRAFIIFLFVLRFFGNEGGAFFYILTGVYFLFSFIFNIFFSYVEYYIVIKKEDIFKAIASSAFLFLNFWKETLTITFLSYLINLRVIINILFFMAIPILISGLIYLGTSFISKAIALIIGGILTLIIFLFVCRLSATLIAFMNGVWTYVFLQLEEKEKVI